MTRLTKRRLEAMGAAVSAMLAGEQGEGDWPEDVTAEDLDEAFSWICGQLNKREKSSQQTGEQVHSDPLPKEVGR